MASPEPTEPATYYRRLSRPDQRQYQHRHQPRQNIKPIDIFQFMITVIIRSVSSDSNPIVSVTLLHNASLFRRIRCRRFLRVGQDFLRSNINHPYFPPECLEQITQGVISEVQQMFELDEESLACPDPDPGVGPKPPDSRNRETFTLLLQIVVDLPEPEDGEHAAMEESMQEVRMIPASKEAIQSLNKIKLEDTKEQCNICMEEFDDGSEEVSATPCNHVFHQQCIVRWLQTSHMCPLCRCLMPTANN